MLKSLGGATMQTKDGLAATMDGLSSLGRSGHTAIDAIAAQSEDLKKLTQETATLMSAFDTGEGQIAHMVSAANKVTAATAGQKQDFDEFWRLLPETLDNARDASASLRNLGGALAPVASDLREAGPQLSDALVELPDTTKDLRGLLPDGKHVLDEAPDTLNKVSDFSDDLRDVIPAGRDMLADVDPILTYLRPYGPDLAAFFANFNAALKPMDEAGRHFIRAQLYFNEKTLTSPTPLSAGTYVNPFPRPGGGIHPGPFIGKYPRLEQLPR
jgi:phospholipid/cholesterol/gamma-HCH transport system substrate-binding protein